MDQLKELIIEDVVLKHPNFEKEFILYVDASGGGLGAVLSQEDEKGKIRPIAFASKTLVGAQNNYSATEMEMLGMHWAVTKQFRPYLIGSNFTVVTDHQALKGIMKSNEGSKRIEKWRLNIQSFVDQMKIEYRPGKKNQNADALSREWKTKEEAKIALQQIFRPKRLKTTQFKVKTA